MNQLQKFLANLPHNSAQALTYGIAIAAAAALPDNPQLQALLMSTPFLTKLVEVLGPEMMGSLIERIATQEKSLDEETFRAILQEEMGQIPTSTLTEIEFYRVVHILTGRQEAQNDEVRQQLDTLIKRVGELQQWEQARQTGLQVGERAVFNQGSVTNSVIVTGDSNVITYNTFVQQAPEKDKPALPPNPFQAPPLVEYFVGREELAEQVAAALRQSGQICVLHGLGGVGKTALATQLANALRSHFPDGVLWANLESIVTNDPSNKGNIRGILTTFAQAYGRDLSQAIDLDSCSRVVREILADKKVLLVLDNAHGTAEVQSFLPPTTESCSVLITTRNTKLLMEKAKAFEVMPFDEINGMALLAQYLKVTPDKVGALGGQKIVQLLGGLPLALKIVASDLARSQELTVPDYYELLKDEQSRLEQLIDRQDATINVRVSFELSFKRLQESARYVFTLLHLLKGRDFVIEAVVAAAEIPAVRVKQAMGDLTTMSLVNRITDTSHSASGRYNLHPLLRLFSEEKMMGSGGTLTSHVSRLAQYYAQLARENRQHGYILLSSEWENIVGALNLAYQQRDWEPFITGLDALTHIHLGVAGFLDAQGYWSIAEDLLLKAVATPQVQDDANDRAWIYLKQGIFAFRQAHWDKAQTFLQQSLTLSESLPPSEVTVLCTAYTYEYLSQLVQRRSPDEALRLVDRGLQILEIMSTEKNQKAQGYLQIRRASILGPSGRLADALAATETGLRLLPSEPTSARVSALMTLGILYNIRGDTENALTHWQEGVDGAQTLGDLRRLAGLWVNMGAAESKRGHLYQAIAYKEKALGVYEQMSDGIGVCVTSANLGEDYTHLGDVERATHLFDLVLVKARHLNLHEREIQALINRAGLFLGQGDLDKVEADLNKAEELCQKHDPQQQDVERSRLWAELAHRRHQFTEALTQIDKTLEMDVDSNEQGMCWRLKGQILVALGEWGLAERAFQHSLIVLADANVFEAARTKFTWGQYCLTNGEPGNGTSLLEQALYDFTILGLDHYIAQTKNILPLLP